MSSLQSEIRRLRKLKDWTQEELAQRLFVQPNTVTQWETGKRSLTVDMFEKILKELGFKVVFNDTKLRLENQMRQISKFIPKERQRLMEQHPTWKAENTGGNYITLSKNLPTLKGDIVGVWIGSEGAGVRQISEEEGYATIEKYEEINNSLNEIVLFIINEEGEFDVEPIAKELFLEETIQELIEKSILLNGWD